jgi:hypothetical protein
MVTSNDLISRYPILEGFPIDTIDLVLAESAAKFDPLLWKNQVVRDQVIGLLTVHVLVMEFDHSQDQTHRFVSIREDKDYKPNPSTDYYNSTPYGKQLQQLLYNQTLGII